LPKKQYGPEERYSAKLGNIMDRLGVTSWDWNCDRYGGMLWFEYQGQKVEFEYTVQQSRDNATKQPQLKLKPVCFGSDAFAQLVLMLEDIERAHRKGIYHFLDFIPREAKTALPTAAIVPECFRSMGFNYLPSKKEFEERRKDIIQQDHPDKGGNEVQFKRLLAACDEGKIYFNRKG
jgi:hypothetical protein